MDQDVVELVVVLYMKWSITWYGPDTEKTLSKF